MLNALEQIKRWSVYLTIFLVPLFFLPWSFEALEWNKQYLLYFLIMVGLLSWLAKMMIEKRIEFHRTPLDLPVIGFWFIVLISSLASATRTQSMLGALNNISFGFVPLTFYTLFYFLATNTLYDTAKIKRAINFLAYSGLVAILFFFLNVFGFWRLIKVNFAFSNTISSLSTVFGVYLILVMCRGLYGLLLKKNGAGESVFSGIIALLSLAALVMVGFKLVWVMTAIALFVLLVFAMTHIEEMRSVWISAVFGIFVVSLIFILIGVPSFAVAQLPLEVSLSAGSSWNIATDTLGSGIKNFVFGSGPATFMYDFAKFRPENLNLTFVWNIRFAEAMGAFLTLLSTVGFLGIVSYVLLILLGLGTVFYIWMQPRWAKKIPEVAGPTDIQEKTLFYIIATLWIVTVCANFLLNYSTVIWVYFFLLSALLMTLSREIAVPGRSKPIVVHLKTSQQYALAASFVFILIFASVVVLGIYLGRFYAADIAYAQSIKSLNAGNFDKSLEKSARAVTLNPYRSDYHLNISRAYLMRAAAELGKSNADQNVIANLVSSAVNAGRYATNLAPNDVTTWESLATMYDNARVLAPDAVSWAIKALDEAIKLEKSNPVHFLRRGNLQLALKQNKEARDDYNEALRLKPNYIDGFAALAMLEEVEGNADAAVAQMANAFRLAPQDPTIMFHLGRMLFNRNQGNDLAIAEQLFAAAVQANPNYSDALFSLAVLYERQGKASEALKLYRRVLQLNPGSTDLQAKVRAMSGQ
jgi:tetratricopeptide (TPR) repeat protein